MSIRKNTYFLQSKEFPELVANQFLIIHSRNNDKQTALGRFDGKDIVFLRFLQDRPFGINPRNAGQKFMQEAPMKMLAFGLAAFLHVFEYTL